MSFKAVLDRLTDIAIEHPEDHKQRGLRDNRLVNKRDLRELLHHFQRLDAEARMGYPPHIKELADAAEKSLRLLPVCEVKQHLLFALHMVRPASTPAKSVDAARTDGEAK